MIGRACKTLIIIAIGLTLVAPAAAHHDRNSNTAAGIIIGGILGGIIGAEIDEQNRQRHEHMHRGRSHRYGRRLHHGRGHHLPHRRHVPLTTGCREGWYYVTLLDGTLHQVWGVTCRDSTGAWRIVR